MIVTITFDNGKKAKFVERTMLKTEVLDDLQNRIKNQKYLILGNDLSSQIINLNKVNTIRVEEERPPRFSFLKSLFPCCVNSRKRL